MNNAPPESKGEEMDIVQLEVHKKESSKSNYTSASSDQTLGSSVTVRGTLPQIEHVHSIESDTLVWLLCVYMVCRTLSPLIRYRQDRNGNGNGSAGGPSQGDHSVLVDDKTKAKKPIIRRKGA